MYVTKILIRNKIKRTNLFNLNWLTLFYFLNKFKSSYSIDGNFIYFFYLGKFYCFNQLIFYFFISNQTKLPIFLIVMIKQGKPRKVDKDRALMQTTWYGILDSSTTTVNPIECANNIYNHVFIINQWNEWDVTVYWRLQEW